MEKRFVGFYLKRVVATTTKVGQGQATFESCAVVSEQADYDNGEKSAILASLVLWDCSPSQRGLGTLSLPLRFTARTPSLE